MSYRPLLFLHWKQIRMALIPFAVAAFALPLLTIEGLGAPPGMDAPGLEAFRIVLGSQEWLIFFPLLAAGIGITLALSAWNWDHQLHHVYALSLPMNRWEYTVSKMLAGVTLALVPTVGMWLGAHVAAASITLPAGLNAYPNELTVRFFFAILVSFGVWFALASGTVKTTMWVLGTFVAIFVLSDIAGGVVASRVPGLENVSLFEALLEMLVYAPGPGEVITGSWSLIDV